MVGEKKKDDVSGSVKIYYNGVKSAEKHRYKEGAHFVLGIPGVLSCSALSVLCCTHYTQPALKKGNSEKVF